MMNTAGSKKGTLIMASNSLGLPKDIPTRSLEALRDADLLVFEEDRPARQSLKAAGIHRDYLKFSEHKEIDTIEEIRCALRKGKTVCYMSDQGVPTLADPGRDLLQIAYNLGAKVEVIPGPSSISTALAACPFLENSFFYKGFLARDSLERSKELQILASRRDPIIFLETPYRRKAILSSLASAFGGDRKALLAVDITGPEEGFYYDSLAKLEKLELNKLNFVVITEGRNPQKSGNPYRKGKSGNKE